MPTQEQVEAVAREIERRTDPTMAGVMLTATPDVIARAAIAAYESIRPAVSDEELVDVFWGGYNQADDSESRKESLVLAGIRAVRERLEGGE